MDRCAPSILARRKCGEVCPLSFRSLVSVACLATCQSFLEKDLDSSDPEHRGYVDFTRFLVLTHHLRDGKVDRFDSLPLVIEDLCYLREILSRLSLRHVRSWSKRVCLRLVSHVAEGFSRSVLAIFLRRKCRRCVWLYHN